VHGDRKPKSEGRFPLTFCQESPPSSLRITCQCFCMKSVSGRDGFIAMRWTQWPDLAVLVGSSFERSPRLMGFHVSPPSSYGTRRRRDGDEHPLRVVGVDDDRVQAEPAGTGLPLRARLVIPEPRQLLPRLARVGRTEERRVLDAGEHRVRVRQRRLEVPDARELPRDAACRRTTGACPGRRRT
jgi:hypothetical protein